MYGNKDSHLTWNVLLHYLIKLKMLASYLRIDPSAAEFAEKTSLAENPPEKNAASRKSAE